MQKNRQPSHPSQEPTEYETDKQVCEGYKRKSDIGIVAIIDNKRLIQMDVIMITTKEISFNLCLFHLFCYLCKKYTLG